MRFVMDRTVVLVEQTLGVKSHFALMTLKNARSLSNFCLISFHYDTRLFRTTAHIANKLNVFDFLFSCLLKTNTILVEPLRATG